MNGLVVVAEALSVDRAAAPEGLDEAVLLVIVGDLEEDLLFLVGDDQIDEL